MTDRDTVVRVEDLDLAGDEPVVFDDQRDLHLSDSNAMERMRTAGTSTSPGSSDEDN